MPGKGNRIELLQGTLDARSYSITQSGEREVIRQAERWRRLAGLVDKLLLEA
jgi:DNA-binding PadR family transcriptional regulator